MVIHSTIISSLIPRPPFNTPRVWERDYYISCRQHLNSQSHQHIYLCLFTFPGRKKKKKMLQCFNCRVDKQTSNPLVKCSAAFLTTSHWIPFLMLQGNDACLPFNHDCSQPRPSHCPVFDCLQLQCAETGWWEGLGTRLDIVHFCNCNNTTYIIKFNFSVNYKDLNRTFVST